MGEGELDVEDTKDWWLSERELRYPGYSSGDFPIYDAKMNSLAVGASTRRFLDVIPESVFVRAGVPSSRDRCPVLLTLSLTLHCL